MTGNINNSGKGNKNSRTVVITGLACENSCLTDFSNFDCQSIFVRLAENALNDERQNNGQLLNEKLDIIIYHSKQTAKIVSSELASQIGLGGRNSDIEASNILQAINIALSQIQFSDCPGILLLMCDQLEQTAAEDSHYLSALILRPLTKAIQTGKKIYASILLSSSINADNLSELDSHYNANSIDTQSINLFTLKLKSNDMISSQVENLSKWFLKNNIVSQIKDPKNNGITNGEGWCSLYIDSHNSNRQSIGLSSFVNTIISLQQRKFLSVRNSSLIDSINLKQSPFYFNFSERPWFYPQVHPQFRHISPQLNYTPSLRRAVFHIIEEDEQSYHMVLEEFENADEIKERNLQPDWPTELFTFFAENANQLLGYLQSIESFILNSPDQLNLKDLSFSINSQTCNLINQYLSDTKTTKPFYLKASFLCANIEEFISKIKSMIRICFQNNFPVPIESSYFEIEDIYWCNQLSKNKGDSQQKLAFVLPGLGAAYPNMLAELCLHFPEVRAIFDYVDYLSISSNSKLKPSDRIFCRLDPRTKTYRETPATLAVMDSAVVSVLMAEWAIFTLLLNLDIVPDVLLGSSTGEFAALTMSGAVDLFKAAPLFYHLSTGMVHALPLDRLINLRSLRVNDSYETIEQELIDYKDKVYLGANLSPRQLILTGDKESINSLLKSFESQNISADYLPFAIPYHTSLVADMVSADDPDIQALQISAPLIESWSCSLAAPYPSKSEKIKQMTTDLFSKPILFRESIESLYEKGVRNFLEVGPRGNLALVISEILKNRSHVSLAANRSDVSAITQLQNTLAILFVNDIFMDLSYLYLRRSANLLSFKSKKAQFETNENYARPFVSTLAKNKSQQLSYTFENTVVDMISITQSFQKQLQELEQQVMTVLSTTQSSVAVLNKETDYISTEISLKQIFPQLPYADNIICRCIKENNLPINQQLLFVKDKILTKSEQEQLEKFENPVKRKEWLAGRIVTKETVRSLELRLNNKTINNMDFEIKVSETGKPFISQINNTSPPVISITHKDGLVMAIATRHSEISAIGIDLESVHIQSDIENLILNSKEKCSLDKLPSEERVLNIIKIWSAKEAVAKALGLGLPDYLNKLCLINANKNLFQLSFVSAEEEALTENHSRKYLAYVASFETKILSIALI